MHFQKDDKSTVSVLHNMTATCQVWASELQTWSTSIDYVLFFILGIPISDTIWYNSLQEENSRWFDNSVRLLVNARFDMLCVACIKLLRVAMCSWSCHFFFFHYHFDISLEENLLPPSVSFYKCNVLVQRILLFQSWMFPHGLNIVAAFSYEDKVSSCKNFSVWHSSRTMYEYRVFASF